MSRVRASMLLLLLPLAAPAAAASPGQPAGDPASPLERELEARLEAGEELSHTLWGKEGLQLLPRFPGSEQLRAELEGLDITIGVEVLRLYRGSADFGSPEARLQIFNILRSVSTMEGIQYYSVTRGRTRTLFAESYVIDGPDSRRRVPDPVAEQIPAYSRLYMFQTDTTFGQNVYRGDYLSAGPVLVLKIRNLTEMRYLILPSVKPEHSLTALVLLPQGSSILFYGVMAAHTGSFLGLERSSGDSFYNRLKALYGWLLARLESAEL